MLTAQNVGGTALRFFVSHAFDFPALLAVFLVLTLQLFSWVSPQLAWHVHIAALGCQPPLPPLGPPCPTVVLQ